MNTKATGYILGACAAATYGMNPLFALPLYKAGIGPDSVLFFRYLFAIPLLGAMLVARGRNFRIGLGDVPKLAVLGLLVAVSSLTLFESYNYMDVGIASTLLFIYPVMVALIMAVFFKERISPGTAVCMAAAFAGIALLCVHDGSLALSLTGTVLVFASSLSYAIYMVAVNHSTVKDMATLKVTFYILLFGLSLFVVRIFMGGGLQTPSGSDWYLWGNLIALGIFPTAISFLCSTTAIRYIGSTPTAILGALEPVTAVFFGIVVFGERFAMREAFGFVLVIASVSGVVAGGSMAQVVLRVRRLFPRLPRHRAE